MGNDEASRFRELLAAERRSADLYDGLAEAARGERREILNQLAAVARRHADPTLVGGSGDEAAGTDRCRQERLPRWGPGLSGVTAMSQNRSCGSYGPGHLMHCIQGKK